MKKTKHFKRTAFPLSAKSMLSLMLLLIAMLVPQGAWAGACAYTPECASIEDMQVHLNGTNGNYNGSANNEVVASLKFNYWLDIFNYDGDNGYWDRDLTMKIDGQTLTFYSDYACSTKVSTDYSTVLQGVWGVFGDSNEDHTIGKNKSGSGNKAYFKTSSGLKGYINIYNYYAASNKWTTMKVEVFIYDLYGHKVSVCGTYKRSGKSDIAYDYVFYLGGCPRPKNVTTSRNTTTKQVTVSWQKETYSIPASDATGETRVKAYNVIDNGNWGVYRNDDYTTSMQTVGNTVTSAADDGTNVAKATCSSSPYTYYVCYEPKATYGSNGTSLKGDVTHQRGLSGSSSITLNHVWGEASWKWEDDGHSATCTRACTQCSQGDASKTSVTVTLNNGITAKQQVAPNCTTKGTTRYTATATVGGTQYSATKDVVDIAALGHSYGAGVWSWADDGHFATCTRTCGRTGCTTNTTGHTSSKSVTLGNGITSAQQVAPKCTEMGTTRYTATATVEGTQYSATKDVVDIAALGHSYGAGSWSWADDGHTATCTRTCGRTGCTTNTTGHTSSKSVTLGNGITSAQQVAPKCTEMGTTRYTATTTVEGTKYSATKDVVDIAALGHGSTGYTPTYTWGGTYDDATCTFTLQCGSCGVEVFNDNITTTKVPHNYVDVTCGKDGNIRWTATGSYSKAGDATYNGEAQVKDYAIPATGLHTFDDDDPAQSVCTVCNHGFFRYTAMAKVEPKEPAELKNAEGMSIYNADKHSFADGMGVMEFDEPLVTIGQLAFLNGFDFTENLTIPNTVTTIGHGAFQSCFRLTGNLIIPNSVTSIGPIAFAGCRFSGNLILPNSVTSIGSNAFDGCNFYNITLQSIPVVQNRAFYQNVGYDEGNGIVIDINFPITISLSDNSYVYTGENPDFPEVSSVTYNRSMQNEWGTLVVPFPITTGDSENYELYKLTGATEEKITLTKVDVAPAGTPLFVRVKDIWSGLSISASNTTVSGDIEEGSAAGGLQLTGVYVATQLADDDYFISKNKFWLAGDLTNSDGVKVAPFRAYLHSTLAGAKARSLSISIDEEVTAINALNAITEGTAECYDMNGRKLNGLQKGVNIVKMSNGKTQKVIIK